MGDKLYAHALGRLYKADPSEAAAAGSRSRTRGC